MSERLRIASYIPELDGLRGLAIGSVLLYHCHEKLHSSHLDVIAQWGWVGVNLFFVLSGFLITGIILDSRDDPHFFRNFYARRGLRIWPVYVLVLLLNYFVVPFVFGSFWWAVHEVRYAPWLHYIFFVQNLFFLALPAPVILLLIFRFLPIPVTPQILIDVVTLNPVRYEWREAHAISPNLGRAVIASEDQNFCNHNGFDWKELNGAWRDYSKRHKPLRGASTLSQ